VEVRPGEGVTLGWHFSSSVSYGRTYGLYLAALTPVSAANGGRRGGPGASAR
jgi:hypothetical protein